MKKAQTKLCAACILLLSLSFLVKMNRAGDAGANASKLFSTHEDFVYALGAKIDLSNPKEVFRFVFFNLRNEVTVYPTENYYYFEFFAEGKSIKGNIGLFASIRDRGQLNFGYEESTAFYDAKDIVVGESTFDETDGVEVKKLTPFRYAVTYQGKMVVFNLNQVEQKMAKRMRLAQGEVFVGQSFDESGLKFLLIFNQKCNHFFWLLNDDETISESFTTLTDNISIGNRTAFAFYDDKENNRKILIGVSADEVKRNSWYDGPFDQLPDNYIATGQVEVKKYMEAAYPYAKGKIDKFGISLVEPDNRLAICSYLEYSDTSELSEMISAAKRKTGKHAPDFYCEITGI
jgi:hypothetical protein